MMGNMDMLCAESKLWGEIKQKLVEQNSLGTSLALHCSIHGKITSVQCEEDFMKVPEGGCNLNCGARLSCSHYCKNICHQKDRDHNNYSCMEPCESIATGYSVTSTRSNTTAWNWFRQAGMWTHESNKPCYIDLEDYKCPRPCDNRVEGCGHACVLRCHIKNDPDHLTYKCLKPCAKPRVGCTSLDAPHICSKKCHEECEPCRVKVKKVRTVCPHAFEVECNVDVDELLCEKPCKKLLPCGHKCRNKCFKVADHFSSRFKFLSPEGEFMSGVANLPKVRFVGLNSNLNFAELSFNDVILIPVATFASVLWDGIAGSSSGGRMSNVFKI
ncbi:hypothetical protein NQ317_014840 [Molorchus minor]|uniref:NFX1-type zinc finger-containing protein 1 n=1 Tax=Molorchus minor TaxID=1323400 RepID=A0ABQ9JSE2_9CUCU|nr:hypothetical protein NQ317_014840 [Molorchus minor]